ncbi:MarR family winged helix-turn-helix transcriptional regulator [Anaerobium acetethylicum]|uniref:DNA-binding transcriptional regulator, MarR family n=1 Tax=Anaerobium acetethylicum TaxID=1619234 RepID=A0A1D3TWT2_9FIRM|nr:MarR family transcriptional regulator [Anaerobium acetethylicum]SCP98717.1 DNA-binding transcriptional regulator, MarR family [Anaerobium acetethylicum]
MEEQILSQVRAFNRFFAVELSVFDRYVLGTAYSLVEGRVIGEVGRNEGCSANRIAEDLNIDKSYLSRVLAKLETKGLISRLPSAGDGRKKQLKLTEAGRELYNKLEVLSDKQAEDILKEVEPEQIGELLESMQFIQTALGKAKV